MKTLPAFCDLSLTAASYDFAVFLVRAMKERDDKGCDKLHVILVPDESGHGGIARKWGEHDEADTLWRLWHIVIAMCPLAGAAVTLAPNREHADWILRGFYDPEFTSEADSQPHWWPEGKAHFLRPLVDAARLGEKIPKLRATDAARRYVARWMQKDSVTVTIRDQKTDPDRNSSRDVERFIDWLRVQGKTVIVIDEVNHALSIGSGHVDIDIRMAMYERAALNIIGNGGPSQLLWFSDAPYLMFNAALPAKDWAAHWQKHLSLSHGDQLPWATSLQRLVYRPDSFEVMKAEFEKWESATN